MCPEVHLLRPLAIIVAIVMNGLIGSAGAVLARGAPDCGARCSELSEWINHVLTSPTFDTFDTCSLILRLTFCAELCWHTTHWDILDKKGVTLHFINFAGLRPAVY